MMPSLDVYSFGMVVLFLFSEKNWWEHSNRSSTKTRQTISIGQREERVKVIVTELEARDALHQIAQQLRIMLHRDPTQRPSAKECVFELGETYYGERAV